ncbi:MAG: hypothetical protein Q9225_000704 [Loekoesia sp. 1 TL-2023]
MGESSFSASRLEISLESPPDNGYLYAPGELLKGAIILHKPLYAAGVEASISFTGTSRVRFKEKGRLFSPIQTHEDELVSWSQANLLCTKQHDRLIWPFCVPIPSNAHSSATRSSPQSSDDENFAKYLGYALPPSFGAPLRGECPQAAERETTDRHVAIIYGLKGTLTKPHHAHPYTGPTICQKEVSISSHPFLDSPVPAFHVDSSMHRISPYNLTSNVLDNNNVHSHNFFLETMKPYIHLHLSMPGTVIAGQALTINVSFDHSFVRSAAEKLPLVILHYFNVNVNSETRVRISGGSRRGPKAKWEEQIIQCSLDAARTPVEKRSCRLTESLSHRWDINALVPQLKTCTLDFPTFKAWNIALSYTLHVQGEVRLDNEKMRFDVKKPLIVLSDHSSKDALSTSGPSPSESSRIQCEAGAPPPYSEHRDTAIVISTTAEEATLPSYQTVLNDR